MSEVSSVIGSVRQTSARTWEVVTCYSGLDAITEYRTEADALDWQANRINERFTMWCDALRSTAPARHPVQTIRHPNGSVEIRQYYTPKGLPPGRAVALAVRSDGCRACFVYSGKTPKAAAKEAFSRAESFLNQ